MNKWIMLMLLVLPAIARADDRLVRMFEPQDYDESSFVGAPPQQPGEPSNRPSSAIRRPGPVAKRGSGSPTTSRTPCTC